jgi:hypothetical protein
VEAIWTMSSTPWLTLIGQLFLLCGALLGAGGGLKYLLEPALRRRRLRKVLATGLWLSCYELRKHMEDIRTTLNANSTRSHEMRNALLKIPRYDYGHRPDWFVKTGYFCMITAYKIAAFSSWMKIYQQSVLQALIIKKGDELANKLFALFDEYKVAVSNETVLWYSYIDAVGEKITSTHQEISNPISFSEFCEKYWTDRNFLYYLDQLHMFIHFLGRTEEPWLRIYQKTLDDMIIALRKIENFIQDQNENLLTNFQPKERTRTSAPERSKELSKYFKDAE